jgi:(2Fe-2S) ferredoxin
MVPAMPAWKHHVFICTNKRPPGHPKGSCADRGCADLLFAFAELVETNDALLETVKVNTTNCLGPCRAGPSVVVYPEAVWYAGVTAADVPEIVREHLIGGRPVERLVQKDG